PGSPSPARHRRPPARRNNPTPTAGVPAMTSRATLASLAVLLAAARAPGADAPGSPGPVTPARPPKQLTVYPPRVALFGPRDEQRLIVLGTWADGQTRDLTRSTTYTSTSPKTATVDAAGIVRPAADGQTSITVEALGTRANVPVVVEKAAADVRVSFTREIEPILTKAGCNSGGCHGASLGRGGFRLSLFGFDPAFDHAQIVQSNEGRRVVVSDPERSILLAKPSLVMEHGGGERLRLNGRDYDHVRAWLEDGAPPPSVKDPEVTRLEVFP